MGRRVAWPRRPATHSLSCYYQAAGGHFPDLLASAFAPVAPPGSYQERIALAAREPAAFWGPLARDALVWDTPYHTVSDCDFRSGRISWFLGGQLNVSGEWAWGPGRPSSCGRGTPSPACSGSTRPLLGAPASLPGKRRGHPAPTPPARPRLLGRGLACREALRPGGAFPITPSVLPFSLHVGCALSRPCGRPNRRG